jgi:activator of HSP90 ATPase
MPMTIQQSVILPATATRLYDMYLDADVHGAITGASVTIGSSAGSAFCAFNGTLSGTILYVVPKRLIVQSWRSNHWKAQDDDSILVLTFQPSGGSGRIDLIHVNVPDHDAEGVTEGWGKYYWTPWQRYLERG